MLVPLTRGFSAIVDDADYPMVMRYKWLARVCSAEHIYASRGVAASGGMKPQTIYLHRWLMDCPPELQVDHINHNTLDNRRGNLRIVTRTQNRINRKRRPRGCKYHLSGTGKVIPRPWQAVMVSEGVQRSLGSYATEAEASAAYEAECRRVHPWLYESRR